MNRKVLIMISKLLLIGLFIPYLGYLETAAGFIANANENNQTIILDESGVKVVTSYTVSEDKIYWHVNYEKESSKENQTRRIRFQFNHHAEATAAFQLENDWYVEREFSKSSSGGLTIVTEREESVLQVRIQLDETNYDGELTDNTLTSPVIETEILTSEQSGPYEIVAEIPEKVATELSEVAPEEVHKQEISETPVVAENQKETAASYSEHKEDDIETKDSEKAPKKNGIDTVGVQGLLRPVAGESSTQDPFVYTEDDLGIYPEHCTNECTLVSMQESIKNYGYGATSDLTEGLSQVTSIFQGDLSFGCGYHDYGDRYLKKSVRPTENANEFKIQLDVIGKIIKKETPVDIVLVVDHSTSMNSLDGTSTTRWEKLKVAVKEFSEGVLSSGDDTQIGLVGFGGETVGKGNDKERVAYSEFELFAENMGFTTDSNKLNQGKVLNKNVLSKEENWGTSTFLGFDVGLSLLTNEEYGARKDAEKVLILLTDGIPTYGPGDGYLESTLESFEVDQENNGLIRHNVRSDYCVGTGNSSNNKVNQIVNTATVNLLNERVMTATAIQFYSIGFYVKNTVNEILEVSGTHGSYTADSQDELIAALNELAHASIRTIKNAQIVDPMSTYVDRVSDVTSTALLLDTETGQLVPLADTDEDYPEYAKKIDDSLPKGLGESLCLTNVNLGGNLGIREGYRIEYTVCLKDEYQDGKFYPANEATYIENDKEVSPDFLHFAVPSVRALPVTRDIEVEKVWSDQDNQWQTRQAIVIQLQQKIAEADWQDVPDKFLEISANATDEALTTIFRELPTYQDGVGISYRIIEKNTVDNSQRVLGYQVPSYTSSQQPDTGITKLTVTNELLTTSITFKKVDQAGADLAGAVFELTALSEGNPHTIEMSSTADGTVAFDNIPIGSYELKEVSAPDGYQPTKDSWQIEVHEVLVDGLPELRVTGLPKSGQVENTLYPFQLTFMKSFLQEGQKVPLPGAEFTLSGDGLEEALVVQSDISGKLVFGPLTPGNYQLKETKAPEGFAVRDEIWQLTINQDRTVTWAASQEESVIELTPSFDLEKQLHIITGPEIVNELNPFELQITKQDNFGKDLAGATFKLENLAANYSEEKQAEGETGAAFVFSNLKPGVYTLTETVTPDGYWGLTEPIIITINGLGKVTVDGGMNVETIYQGESNQINLTVINKKINALPVTGSSALQGFMILSLVLLITSKGLGYTYLNRKEGE